MAKFNFGAFLVALAVGKTLLLLYYHQLHGSRLEMDWLLNSVLLVLGNSSIVVAAAVLLYVVYMNIKQSTDTNRSSTMFYLQDKLLVSLLPQQETHVPSLN
jgi:hypothetical protein